VPYGPPPDTSRLLRSRTAAHNSALPVPTEENLGSRASQFASGVPHYWRRFWRMVSLYMPKRLYARSLLIIITPMILLQSVIAFVFMERHWQTVTQRLSQAVVRDVAAIIDMIDTFPQNDGYADVIRIAQDRLSLKIDLLPPDPLKRDDSPRCVHPDATRPGAS